MKKVFNIWMLMIFTLSLYAQEITGKWNGLLKAPSGQLRLVFNITNEGDSYQATMDSPDQNAFGFKATSVNYHEKLLTIKLNDLMIEFSGKNENGLIKGNFKQATMSFPLNLSREDIEKKALVRPQEPVEPFPYKVEEVLFENTIDKIKLAGTLTIPSGLRASPAVVLISGSGPQNRDEEVFGHKPFLVLADHLTREGIAVLRFDDRGVAKSEGNFAEATSVDFARDVKAAIEFLKTREEINHKQIGLIGHSEGGIIAPIVASESPDVAFIVLLAGTGIRGSELLLMQQQLIGRAYGSSEEELKQAAFINMELFEIIPRIHDTEELKKALSISLKDNLKNIPQPMKPQGISDDEFVAMQIRQLVSPWMRFFLAHDPAPVLRKVKCPVLAVNGEKDLQVPPRENLSAIEKALSEGGNTNITVVELSGLNHLFQECETGSPAEYAEIEQTFSPLALEEISKWIKNIIK
jgi:pimeloyl-ACP methyl ester carboxylesterase